jgi:hypothetical protein
MHNEQDAKRSISTSGQSHAPNHRSGQDTKQIDPAGETVNCPTSVDSPGNVAH